MIDVGVHLDKWKSGNVETGGHVLFECNQYGKDGEGNKRDERWHVQIWIYKRVPFGK